MSTTPFMGLIEPDVGITPGPTWAQLLNALTDLIDSHDHTPGKGALLTPAGFVVNQDFNLNSFALLMAKYVQLVAQGSPLTNPGTIYQVGGNFYFTNGSGAPVQITSGSAVNAPGSGAISASVVASPYTVVPGDAQKVLVADTFSSSPTLNLPPATTAMFIMIKDGKSNAQTFPVIIHPDTTDLIDNMNADYLIDYNDGSVGLVSDGVSKWYVV